MQDGHQEETRFFWFGFFDAFQFPRFASITTRTVIKSKPAFLVLFLIFWFFFLVRSNFPDSQVLLPGRPSRANPLFLVWFFCLFFFFFFSSVVWHTGTSPHTTAWWPRMTCPLRRWVLLRRPKIELLYQPSNIRIQKSHPNFKNPIWESNPDTPK